MISKILWTSSYAISGSMAYLLIKSCYKELLIEYNMLPQDPIRKHDISIINPGFITLNACFKNPIFLPVHEKVKP